MTGKSVILTPVVAQRLISIVLCALKNPAWLVYHLGELVICHWSHCFSLKVHCAGKLYHVSQPA